MRGLEEDKPEYAGPGVIDKALSARGVVGVTIAADEESLQAFQAFVEMRRSGRPLSTDDIDGVARLHSEDRLFIVPQNTRIVVIGAGVNTTEVRILEGDQIGRSGRVLSEAVVLDASVSAE